MDPANAREAMKEVALDLEEGADIVMVKPALPYLDMIRRVRERCRRARGCVQRQRRILHGESRRRNGWLDENRAVLEILTGIHRAGANIILTYHAKDVARWLAS